VNGYDKTFSKPIVEIMLPSGYTYDIPSSYTYFLHGSLYFDFSFAFIMASKQEAEKSSEVTEVADVNDIENSASTGTVNEEVFGTKKGWTRKLVTWGLEERGEPEN